MSLPDTVRKHYDTFLAHHYSWMLGNVDTSRNHFKELLKKHGINAKKGDLAVDLGAGTGLHTIAAAEAGFSLTAIDFCRPILDELRDSSASLPITIVHDDLRHFTRHLAGTAPRLIICGGDTLTHLSSKSEVSQLIAKTSASLAPDGYLYVSFRDYTNPLSGTARFIPVKADPDKLMTCFLEYTGDIVNVSDIISTRQAEDEWTQNVSTYSKIVINPDEFAEELSHNGFRLLEWQKTGNMHHFICRSDGPLSVTRQ